MIDNGLISSKTVLAKAIADLDISESKLRISDWREWILEAMLKIGAIKQFDHKVTIIKLDHGQALLPCDLYKLGQVGFSFSGTAHSWLPMRRTTSSFGVRFDFSKGNPKMLIKDDALIPLVKNMFNLVDDRKALDILNDDPNLRETLSILVNQWTLPNANGRPLSGPPFKHIDLLYTTKPGYIITNVPDGYVKLEYYAIYTDEEGMPLIPDSESYKEAIFWYLATKHYYPKYVKGDIKADIYNDMRRNWSFYCGLAYGEAMMPTTDDMTSIQNEWNKLYPELNDNKSFFESTGEQQHLFNWSK